MAEICNNVLIVGGEGEKCCEVVEDYGFKKVVTSGNTIEDNRHITPFRKLTQEESDCSRTRILG